MKYKKHFVLAIVAVGILATAQMTALGQTNDGKIANMAVSGGSVRWDISVSHAGGTLTVTFPDGRAIRKAVRAGSSPEINLSDKQLEGLPDGPYSYDLSLAPVLTPSQKEEIAKARGKDDDAENERMLRKRPAVPSLNQSGTFTISNGMIIGPGAVEGQAANAKATETRPVSVSASRLPVSANTISRLRNHRAALAPMFDFVINDDLIVIGSACVGLDCVNGEVFGFDTIRMKENNLRIHFDDTSVSAGFPANDWRLIANDSASGGQSKFSIEDSTAARTPFTVEAGAANNSIYVDSTSRVGFRTSTPVLDLHMNTSDTPAVRFEQNNSGGFSAQTWDIGANEANFFVRDVTSGSRLSFRIRPGAPTSSLDIAADGNVGVGTATPDLKLDVETSEVNDGAIIRNTNATTGGSAPLFLSVSNATSNISNTSVESISLGGSTAADMIFRTGATSALAFGSERLRILGSNGRVGIGTNIPDQLLSVNGDASKVGGGSWQSFSDERLKNIKGRFNLGLKAVMQLQPLRYEYKPQNVLGLKSEGEHVGFGAQALQRVIPEAVTKNSEGYLMVNNDPILWTMLNAIKEQQKEIEQLRGEIQKLRTASNRHRK